MHSVEPKACLSTLDYRRSHLAPDKGITYDQHYRDIPWRRYLWSREQAALFRILSEYLDGRSIRYLDFACGTGRIIQFLEPFVDHPTGIDLSDTMLQVCRDKLPNTEILTADLTERDILGERKFDLITAFRFFTNAQPDLRRQTMTLLVRHLSDDGVLVINNHRNASSLLLRMSRALNKTLHSMTEQEVIELTSHTGLSIVNTFPIGLWPGHDSFPMVLPAWCHRILDRSANRCGLGRSLCQDVLYVCKKISSSGPMNRSHLSDSSNLLCEAAV